MESINLKQGGPDQIKVSSSYTSTSLDDPVQLRMGITGPGALEPMSIPTMFQRIVERYPSYPALAYKDATKQWNFISYKEYHKRVEHIAKAFIKIGLEPRKTVGIIAFNSPEWFISELATIHCGGIVAGIYPTNSAEAVLHNLTTSQANIVVVDDTKQMMKIREIKNRLPLVKYVIQLNGPYENFVTQEKGYYKWSDIEKMDVEDITDSYKQRLEDICVNECCSVIYTSGTVGFPKGVMLSHDNIIWDTQRIIERFPNVTPGNEIYVSYLPLSHVAAQLMDIFIPIMMAGVVYFADRDALKGSLVKTLAEVRPTRFVFIPRVLEKIEEKMVTVEREMNIFKKTLINWAKVNALDYHLSGMSGDINESIQYKLAKKLALNKIKTSLGLDRCKLQMCGAAPTAISTKKYFMSLDIKVVEVFGMSECAGLCLGPLDFSNFDTVGKPIDGILTKIDNPDANGRGEICTKGRHVFMGYAGDPEKTSESIDDDGWLHTGDLGRIDDEGLVYITGRIKEIIITAGGENIPPANIEQLIKAELPALSNAYLVGERRKFLSVLLTIKTEMDTETGSPLDKLHPETLEWLQTLGLEYKYLTDILNAGPCPKICAAIQEGVDRANLKAISNAQRVQKFALLPHDFSIATGELGPTLKLKRNVVAEKYEQLIDSLY